MGDRTGGRRAADAKPGTWIWVGLVLLRWAAGAGRWTGVGSRCLWAGGARAGAPPCRLGRYTKACCGLRTRRACGSSGWAPEHHCRAPSSPPRPSPPDWVCQKPAGALGSRAHVPGAPHWRPQVTARSRGPARNRRRQCKRFAVGLGAGKTPQTGAVPGAGCPGVHRCSPYSKGLGRLCRCTSV